MSKDRAETMMLDESTVWAETAMQGARAPLRTVTVGLADLESAVHGGVISGAQAKALWTRLTDPALAAAQASSPGQRPLPFPPPEATGARTSPMAIFSMVMGVLAVVALLLWFAKH